MTDEIFAGDFCSKCGDALPYEAPGEPRRPCARCGRDWGRRTERRLGEVVTVTSRLNTTVRDASNEVVAESLTMDVKGGETGTGMDYRAGTYGRIATIGPNWKPPTKHEVHEAVGVALVAAVGGRFEHVDEKREKFPDIRLFLPGPLGVEVRHLDDEATRRLYAHRPKQPQTMQIVEDFDQLRHWVHVALDDKGDYDAAAMRAMWLALYLPFAPSIFVREEIRSAIRVHRQSAARQFGQVWLVSTLGAERVDKVISQT